MSGLHLPTISRSADIQLTGNTGSDLFCTEMAQLYLNDDYSDVTFVVKNQRLPAHRALLAARSGYFRTLLYGGFSESNQSEIELKVPIDAFKALLRYIYSGQLSLSQMDEDKVMDTLGLANQYGLTELVLAISDHLREYLDLTNVCSILDASRLWCLDKFRNDCLTFMDRNASDILTHESFKSLSKETLEEVLRRDSFFAPEIQIFSAVWEWCKQNKDVDIQSVVSSVRLPLMKQEHLLQIVRPSGILDPDKLLDAIGEQIISRHLPYRAALWPEENVATAKFFSRTITGGCCGELLNGDVKSYGMKKGYTHHRISALNDISITVELGTICIINHVKILLFDRDNRCYSYFIEVSANQTQWDRVIDYSDYHCRSWQFLYFNARPVRYIKLTGTHNTVNQTFHVVALEAMYTANIPKVLKGIVVPMVNVATIDMSAAVLDGNSILLNGNYIDYGWDFGYTFHMESGKTLVRLGQPYIIGSMRLLLWDCDDRTYSFYIETSINQKDWVMVVDKRNEQARSWQNFSFNPLPVVFIRIGGTCNTANMCFQCVHMECPSQDVDFLLMEKEKQRTIEEKSAKELNDSSVDQPSTSKTTTTLRRSARKRNSNTPQIEEDVTVNTTKKIHI